MTRYVVKIEKIDDETGETEVLLDSAASGESYTGYEFIGEDDNNFRMCGGGMTPYSLAQAMTGENDYEQAVAVMPLLKMFKGGSNVQDKD